MNFRSIVKFLWVLMEKLIFVNLFLHTNSEAFDCKNIVTVKILKSSVTFHAVH